MTAPQPIPQSFIDQQLLQRLCGFKIRPNFQMYVLHSDWCWCESLEGKAYWVNGASGTVLLSERDR